MPSNVGGLGAHRHVDPDLLRPLPHGVGHHPVETHHLPYHGATMSDTAEGGPAVRPPEHPGLLRAIGRADLTAAIVNGVIGSAIFGLPATLAGLTGVWSPVACLLGGLGVLAIVLCFAEVATRFRDPGGPYLYAREAFGKFAGFEVGWLTFWTRVLSAAANLNVFVIYLATLLPAVGSGRERALAMVAVVGIITALNVVGVRQATWAVDLFTLAKLAPLGVLILLGIGHIRPEVLASQTVARPDWTQAILLLVFAYGGFEAPLIPASEARNPERDTGFALLAGLGLIAIIYMLVQLVLVGVVPEASQAKAPIAAVFSVLLGPAGAALAGVAALLSVWGYTTGAVLQSPRVLFSMAERGELPGVLARVSPRFRTPDVSILVFALVSLGLGLAGSFASNATFAAIVRLVYYGLTCGALLVFRRRRGPAPGFRLPFAPVIAPAAILFCLWLLTTRTFEQTWVLAALMVAGLPFFWLTPRRPVPAPPR
jgi:APA family basic amino acid/polyamine antiporter